MCTSVPFTLVSTWGASSPRVTRLYRSKDNSFLKVIEENSEVLKKNKEVRREGILLYVLQRVMTYFTAIFLGKSKSLVFLLL